MKAFEVSELLSRRERSGESYLEFLRVPSLTTGIYALPKGGVDRQTPHTEDEVYYVLSGRGFVRVGGEEREVKAGSLVLVEAEVEHRFHSITEDLKLLVFFAPAEYFMAS